MRKVTRHLNSFWHYDSFFEIILLKTRQYVEPSLENIILLKANTILSYLCSEINYCRNCIILYFMLNKDFKTELKKCCRYIISGVFIFFLNLRAYINLGISSEATLGQSSKKPCQFFIINQIVKKC